ncbi:hypothetical protein EYB53_023655 [Candidatus Chloroploca sp. M-50]|uniref:Uncharacterized protein n=1 Tax=Candidatus Chloroploca mongolica TaxID=2528176 RepID=A0ABS4DH14_9CHLR|nr:hypothetical protein [Candidatus Chloroploca mongolica]MBP1468731.1 hypothetical protein [Candidatus Chloroploca mongolica]
MVILLPDNDPALTALADALDHARATSYPLSLLVARLAEATPGPASAALDALAEAAGWRGLGAAWIEVPRRIAAKLVTHLIVGELAYPTEVMPSEKAEVLASQFLALFPQGSRYFTNGAISGDVAIYDLQGEAVIGWRSLSEAPFDNGIMALGGGRVGMLWAEDAP